MRIKKEHRVVPVLRIHGSRVANASVRFATSVIVTPRHCRTQRWAWVVVSYIRLNLLTAPATQREAFSLTISKPSSVRVPLVERNAAIAASEPARVVGKKATRSRLISLVKFAKSSPSHMFLLPLPQPEHGKSSVEVIDPIKRNSHTFHLPHCKLQVSDTILRMRIRINNKAYPRIRDFC